MSVSEESKMEPNAIFKVMTLQTTSFSTGSLKSNKKKTWKSLKQILAVERSLQWPKDAVLYNSVNAPPSFLPVKKYSDISGLPACYTDPQSKLRFCNIEEYSTVTSLPMDITAGYLALRRASSIV